jgi:hypothetical protein
MLKARELLELTLDEIWELAPEGSSDIEFDDGIVEDVLHAEIYVCWHFWQVHAYYPQLALPKSLILDGKDFTDKWARKAMSTIINESRNHPDISKEDIQYLVFSTVYNGAYNSFAEDYLEFISTTDSDDVDALLFDADIKEANDKVTHDTATVDHAYSVIKDQLNSKEHRNNPISRSVRYGTVKLNQMFSSIGPRGRTTDIDSEIYRIPVPTGFSYGFTRLEDFCKESRSAAKALIFNKDPVAMAEYFNRKLQFLCGVITHISRKDCGTTDRHTITIPDGDKGDSYLYSLEGLYMDTNIGMVPIESDMTHLKGKAIELRTTMTCRDLPSGGVCEACYGEMSYSLAEGDNPGHVSGTAICEDLTQNIISTKHLDFIIYNMLLVLTKKDSKFLALKEKDNEHLYLEKSLDTSKYKLRLSTSEASSLVDVRTATNTDILDLSSISRLTRVEFCTFDEDGVITDAQEVNLFRNGSCASFTPEFLRHIQEKGWVENSGKTIINLKGWLPGTGRGRKPIFAYPHKHENMVVYGSRVESFLRSSGGEKKAARTAGMLTQYSDPTHALIDAYILISDKISGVHLGHIATILAASRARDPENGDYFMPASLHDGVFVKHDELIAGRSGGVSFLYEDQKKLFSNLDMYMNPNRMPSIMDDLIYIPPGKYGSVR